jgi:hypothetical protein
MVSHLVRPVGVSQADWIAALERALRALFATQ